MSWQIAAVGEVRGGRVNPSSTEVLSRARELGLRARLLAVAERGEEVLSLPKGSVLFKVEASPISGLIPLARAISERISPSGEIVALPSTPFGKALAGTLSGVLGLPLVSDCTGLEVEGERAFLVKPSLGDRFCSRVELDGTTVATFRPRSFMALELEEADPEEVVEVEGGEVEVLGRREKEGVDVKEAEVVLVAGRGCRGEGELKLLEELARLLGGVVGASRPLVDEGIFGRERQVGFSGNVIKPKLYVSFGVSGSPQHQAGMRESGKVVAVNSDPTAPIFEICDLGLVADCREVLPKLLEKLKGR